MSVGRTTADLAPAERKDVEENRADCPRFKADKECAVCEHVACGWCPDCHPEVPDWTI